ncbi:MAG TPA: outer membrane beta-barrel family protein [Balneolales bacterium]|nr:outer membrane beta-barrel family protein [Balneolales bacterium]
MLKKVFTVLVFSIAFTNLIYAQESVYQNNGSIKGQIFDAETRQPIYLSDVILFTRKDSTQVSGTATDKNGKFTLDNVNNGKYYLVVQYLGFEKKVFPNISITNSNNTLDLGKINLKPTSLSMQNVVVQGRRSAISYQTGKKVIDVSQMPSSMSGSAADVLQNVPSISVDINGTVSLRGSQNFQVLINGQPSVLSAQDALQQIPASSIKSIELITNPSAKYDASGTAGIINIVLKKNANLGMSGLANIMGGLNQKYGGNFIFQYKTSSISYNFGLDYNRRFYPGSSTQDKQFIVGNNTSYLNSDGNMTWGRTIYGVRGGVDFNLSEKDNLSLGGRVGNRSFLRNSTQNYQQWSVADPQKISYLDNTHHNHYGGFYDLNANYRHTFGPAGNLLTGEFFFRHRSSNESSVSDGTQNSSQINGTETTELGPESELRGKLDYVLPLSGRKKFSAGMEYFTRLRKDINKLSLYDSTSNVYQFKPTYSHTNDFNRTRFAAYSIFADHWDSLGVQIGVRTEYTYQMVKMVGAGKRFSLSRWDFFPSIHSSYNFGDGTQIMAGYSRRIRRPDGGDLEPFYSWYDAHSVRIGNPNLQPEFIDSYEVGFQTFIGKATFSNDFYYRFTHNKMQDINSVYAPNVSLRSIANVGSDYSLGSEAMIMFNPLKFWEFNLMGDVYDYRIKGAINNQSFSRQSFDWSLKNNSTFTITPSTSIQVDTRYHSPSVNAQGRWGGYFITDLAAKQDFMQKSLSIILQIHDLFQTGRREFTSQGVDFYNYNYFTRQAPIVMINIKYNFNDFKKKR